MNDNKESYIDEAKRRIAHLSYKLEQAETKIHKLEYDNAELQTWVNSVCVPRLVELSTELASKYNSGMRYRNTNWKKDYGRELS